MAAATEQEYFPEWIFTGTALTDTNILARGWDPSADDAGVRHLAARGAVGPGPAGRDHALPLVLR